MFLRYALVKTDSQGRAEWTRTFGGIYNDRAQAVVVTADGGCTVGGCLSGDTSRYGDFALVHMDASGDSIWGRVYGGRRDDVAYGLVQTSDGGYALVGFTGSFGFGGGGGRDVWLLRTNDLGDSLWSHTYGGQGWDDGFAIQQTFEGGFILAGYTDSFGGGADDMWLIKTDSIGDSLWSRTYGGTGLDEARSVVQTADGGYAVAGYVSFSDMWLVKTDNVGTMQWNRAFSGPDGGEAYDVIELPTSGYLLAGSYGVSDGNRRSWLVRTDAQGDSLWSTQWGVTTRVNSAHAVQLTPDGGFVAAGVSGWDPQGIVTGDACLTKFARDPLDAEPRRVFLSSDFALAAYPNPFNPTTTITFSLAQTSEVNVRVFDITGRLIQTLADERFTAGEHSLLFDGSALPSGIYFVCMRASDAFKTQKIVLLK